MRPANLVREALGFEQEILMIRARRATVPGLILAVLAMLFGASSAVAATWSSTDQWGTWSNGGYTLYNNIWGGGAGPQTIWANSYSNWGVWANNNAYEIMLWMNKTGPVGPLGTSQGNVTVGGHSWTVYKGTNGANAVFSFIRSGNTSAGTVDILAVMKWIQSKGWFGNVTLGNVQFGYEITSSSGGLDFRTNSYSVTK